MTEYFVLSGADSPGDPFAVQQPDGPDLYLRAANIVDILGFFMTEEPIFEDSGLLEGDYLDYSLNYYTAVLLPIKPSFKDEVTLYWEATLAHQHDYLTCFDGDHSQDITRDNIMAIFSQRFGEQVADALDIAARLVIERDALPMGYDHLTPEEFVGVDILTQWERLNGAPCSRCGKTAEIPDDEHWCRREHLCDGCYDALNPEPVPTPEDVEVDHAYRTIGGKLALGEHIDPNTGEVIVGFGDTITFEIVERMVQYGQHRIEILMQEKAK